MNQGPCFPFLCRSALLPGESLASLLVRLAALNAYASPYMVERVIQERLTQSDDPVQPMLAETYQVLQQLTTLPSGALYQATAHPWARMMNGLDENRPLVLLPDGITRPLLPTEAQKQLLWSSHHICYCPYCLRATAYHRMVWQPRAAAVCLEHDCLLVQGCQVCHTALSMQAVVQRHCLQCHFDLTQAVTSSVVQDDFGLFAQTTLWRWLEQDTNCPGDPLTTASQFELWSKWACSMPQEPPAVLYQVVAGLQRALYPVEPEWFYWHPTNSHFSDRNRGSDGRWQRLTPTSLAPELAYSLYATAFKALVNWPDGFYEFLDAYQRRHGCQVTSSVAQVFGVLYSHCLEKLWLSPHFHFVQVAFNRYLAQNYPLRPAMLHSRRYQHNPQLAPKFPHLTAEEAA